MLGRTAPVFDAHEAICRLGVEGARRAAASALERACIDAAAAMAASRSEPSVTIYGDVAITCLPHRDVGRGLRQRPQSWRRALGGAVYTLESATGPDGRPVGIPYGAKARIILLHFVNGAVVGGSSAVEVPPSMRAWMQAMGIALGGMTYRHIAEQARRIASCRVRIEVEGTVQAAPFETFVEALEYDGADRESGLSAATGARGPFPSRVALNRRFYARVTADPALLDLTAVRQISDNSWALDLYVWLAAILPRLAGPTRLSWDEFFGRIDFGYAQKRKIRAKFLETLPLVTAVYPQADVTVDAEGLWFERSPPAAERPRHPGIMMAW